MRRGRRRKNRAGRVRRGGVAGCGFPHFLKEGVPKSALGRALRAATPLVGQAVARERVTDEKTKPRLDSAGASRTVRPGATRAPKSSALGHAGRSWCSASRTSCGPSTSRSSSWTSCGSASWLPFDSPPLGFAAEGWKLSVVSTAGSLTHLACRSVEEGRWGLPCASTRDLQIVRSRSSRPSGGLVVRISAFVAAAAADLGADGARTPIARDYHQPI